MTMELATTIAFALLGLAGTASLIRLLLGPTLADRMVALDTLLFLMAGALGVYVARTGEASFIPAIVLVTLVAFLGTVVVARYIETESGR
jgi:multicomponent Na+:H+ antiporter subunit F